MKTFTFELFEGITVLATVTNNRVSQTEILKGKRIPTRVYNSYLNQAHAEALKIWDFVIDVVLLAHNDNEDIIETSDFIDGVLYSYKYFDKNR